MDKDSIILIDPRMENSLHFNPMTRPDEFRYFLKDDDPAQTVALMYAIHILSELDECEGVSGRYSTPINLARLLQNTGGIGRKMVVQFSMIPYESKEKKKEQASVVAWFMDTYFPEGSDRYKRVTPCIDKLNALNSGVWKDIINPDYDAGERSELDKYDKDRLFMSVSWLGAKKDPIDAAFTDFIAKCL